MNSYSFLVIGIMLSVLAIAGLFRPFLGMLVFVVIHFVQPGELVPAIASLRIEMVYGTLLIGIIIYQRAVRSTPSLLSDHIVRGAMIFLGAAALSVPFAVWRGGAATTV